MLITKTFTVLYVLYTSVRKGITPPSSVCILNESAIDCIRPPDQFIDLEIKAVKLAKENKRKIYFEKLEKLQEKILADESNNGHWKITVLNLELLLNLQSYLEIPTRLDILLLFHKEAAVDHPLISRQALQGISRVVNKLCTLTKYDYDIRLMYDLNFVAPHLTTVDTRPDHGVSYKAKWQEELQNTEYPNYYIDYKPSVGWLFWKNSLLAVDSTPFTN